jgi:hypothetical protein
MIQTLALILRPFINLTPVRRVRRNHGLEHATIHLLSRKIRNLNMAGRSVIDGFFLYGNADTETVRAAVEEAITRMRNGEHTLAIHPNCGTGLVTAGFLTSLTTLLGTIGVGENWREKLSRLPTLIVLSTAAIILAQPMGLSLQRHITTLGDLGDLEVVDISRYDITMPFSARTLTVHRVRTQDG